MSMSIEGAVTPEAVRDNLMEFVARQVKKPLTVDLDLFGSGLVSSLFALQLVLRVETAFDVSVQGPHLTLDNFRTINAITELVLRLRREHRG